jgi:hypothetical protein
MLLDSNIIIYSTKPEYAELRRFVAERVPAVSAVSLVEVLGYHKLSEPEKLQLEVFFSKALILPLSERVVEWAVQLRQQRKMSLGDALVAGTAVTHHRILVTRNTKDFAWIPDLHLLNPFEE